MASTNGYANQQKAVVSWLPPMHASIEINVDSAWDQRSRVVLVTIVARKTEGIVLCFTAKRFLRVDLVLFVKLCTSYLPGHKESYVLGHVCGFLCI